MNKIVLAGRVASKPQFSHRIFDSNFYEFTVAIPRHSGVEDTLKCVAPVKVARAVKMNQMIELDGRISSRKVLVSDGYLVTELFVAVSKVSEYVADINTCEIWGRIIEQPYIEYKREDRQVAKFTILSPREDLTRNDYIRCLAWQEDALEAVEFEEGEPVHIVGRLQSRFDSVRDRMQYEVSIPRKGVLERWEQ